MTIVHFKSLEVCRLLFSILDFTYCILHEQVLDDPSSVRVSLRERLTGDDPDLTKDERLRIRVFLEAYPDDEQ